MFKPLGEDFSEKVEARFDEPGRRGPGVGRAVPANVMVGDLRFQELAVKVFGPVSEQEFVPIADAQEECPAR